MEDAQVLEGLLEIVKQKKPESYRTVIEEQASYPYLYHLSEARTNLISWLPLHKGMRVLECNAECGALTGKLLEAAGEVVSITECEAAAAIIRERYQGFILNGTLTVLVDQLPALGEFDMALLVGDTWRFAGMLRQIRGLLKIQGKLYLADANRLGVKYMAGCQEEYHGGYFSGLENYQGQAENKKRCYTKEEYIQLLEDCGLVANACYYPYPDHKFPSCIYSDFHLPKEGELADNRRNFDSDRVHLFDERSMFDTLLREGLFDEFSNSFLIEAITDASTDVLTEQPNYFYMGSGKNGRTVYVKYSDERDGHFAVRTEITMDKAREKSVCKYALREEGKAHIDHIRRAYGGLSQAYKDSGICFGACGDAAEHAWCVSFPFVWGVTLQELLECAVQQQDMEAVEQIVREYIRRIRSSGGNETFVVTPEFLEVFGDGTVLCAETGTKEAGAAQICAAEACAAVSDIDMIFSNILAAGGEDATEEPWTVIDYEWTFFFPIPKSFVIYRALHFAYYQILHSTAWTVQELYDMAEITADQAALFAGMEEHFQAYLGKGVLPLRNMQRLFQTKIWDLPKLLEAAGQKTDLICPEAEWVQVKKIEYHIDRLEYQDGSFICCGWAFAQTKDGRNVPVDIHVLGADGRKIHAEVHRLLRQDVAQALNITRVTSPMWGFDCVWDAPPVKDWQVQFSLGDGKAVFSASKGEKDTGKRKFWHLK